MARVDLRTYPAIFTHDVEEGNEYEYSVTFPDFPGCITEGKTLEHAAEMAREALALHIYGMEDDGDPMPSPSKWVHTEVNEALVLITVNMDAFRENMANRAIKKTLTIPAALNERAERAGINFSQVLQEALRDRLGL